MTENQPLLKAPGEGQNPNKEIQVKPESPFSKIRTYLRSEEVLQRFAEILGEREARAYVASVLLAVTGSNALQECTPQSIMIAAMRAATLHLSCDPATGHAFLVPFKGKATLIVGYKGLDHMAIRTGKYRHLAVNRIYEGMVVEENLVTGVHAVKGNKFANDSKVVGYLSYLELRDGFTKTEYMTVEEIHAHAARYSPSYNDPKGPWTKETPKMERKTALRLFLSHWGYLDPHDAAALAEVDEKDTKSNEVEGVVISDEFSSDRDEDWDLTDQEYAEKKAKEVERKESTNEQLADSLGFEAPAPKAKAAPAGPPSPPMTLEEAKAVTTKDKVPYGQVPPDELDYHLKGLERIRKDLLTDEQKRKIEAIRVIQAAAKGQ